MPITGTIRTEKAPPASTAVVVSGLALGVDAACYSAMTKKIPLYPNARVT